jgi:hypothetical protein
MPLRRLLHGASPRRGSGRQSLAAPQGRTSLGDGVLRLGGFRREGHELGGADREIELDGEDDLAGVAADVPEDGADAGIAGALLVALRVADGNGKNVVGHRRVLLGCDNAPCAEAPEDRSQGRKTEGPHRGSRLSPCRSRKAEGTAEPRCRDHVIEERAMEDLPVDRLRPDRGSDCTMRRSKYPKPRRRIRSRETPGVSPFELLSYGCAASTAKPTGYIAFPHRSIEVTAQSLARR